jgi:hypothetical protein
MTGQIRDIRTITNLWAILGLLAIPLACTSPMIASAPRMAGNPFSLLFIASLVTFPVVCFAAVLFARPLSRNQQYKAAFCFSALPVVNIIAGAIAYACMGL